MKMHHFLNGFWDQAQPTHHSSSLSSLSSSPPTAVCKRQRCSLAPKMAHNSDTSALASFHLNSFTRPHHTAPRTLSADDHHSPAPVEAHPRGTRWNPTQEQIGILEMLYKEGTRTPNTHLIDHITHKLAEYGKIEGKNVFYWFQNHKARERQKQKLEQLGHNPKPKTPHSPPTTVLNLDLIATEQEEHVHKRRCRRWTLDRRLEEEGSGWRTLQLFPLRPDGKGETR